MFDFYKFILQSETHAPVCKASCSWPLGHWDSSWSSWTSFQSYEFFWKTEKAAKTKQWVINAGNYFDVQKRCVFIPWTTMHILNQVSSLFRLSLCYGLAFFSEIQQQGQIWTCWKRREKKYIHDTKQWHDVCGAQVVKKLLNICSLWLLYIHFTGTYSAPLKSNESGRWIQFIKERIFHITYTGWFA